MSPRTAASRSATPCALLATSSSSSTASAPRASSASSLRSSPLRRAARRTVHWSGPATTPACRASSSHSAVSPASPPPCSGAADEQVDDPAARERLTGRRRQAVDQSGQHAHARRPLRHAAGDGQPGSLQGGGGRLDIFDVRDHDGALPGRYPAATAARTARTASRISARSSETEQTTSEPSSANSARSGAPSDHTAASSPLSRRSSRRIQSALCEPERPGDVPHGEPGRRHALGHRDQDVRATAEQRADELLLRLIQVVEPVQQHVSGEWRALDDRRGLALERRAVEQAARGELVAVRAVQKVQVGGLGARGPRHVRRWPCRRPRHGLAPPRAGLHARLAQVAERRGERLREVRAIRHGAEVPQVGAVRRDDAPGKPLPCERAQGGRRRTAVGGDEVGGQAPQRGDLEIGDGLQPPHQEILDARAHRGRPDHDGDARERPAALEAGDALYECAFELTEAAADERPVVCLSPGRHGRGERTTRSGRVGGHGDRTPGGRPAAGGVT